MKRCLWPIQVCADICTLYGADHENCVKCTGERSPDKRTVQKHFFRINEGPWNFLLKKIDGRRFLLVIIYDSLFMSHNLWVINKPFIMPIIREIFLHKNFIIKEISKVKKFQKFMSWFHMTICYLIPLQNVTKFSWAYVSFLELSDQMTPKNYSIDDVIKKFSNSWRCFCWVPI